MIPTFIPLFSWRHKMEDTGECTSHALRRLCSRKPPKHGKPVNPARERHGSRLPTSLSAPDLKGLETSPKESTSSEETQIDRIDSLWHGFFHLWRHKSFRRFSSFPPFGMAKHSKTGRRSSSKSLSENQESSPPFFVMPSCENFTISQLEKATDHFSPENLIGKGGFSEIYRGCLDDGQLVAVKRIAKGTSDEITQNFLSEMGILVHVNHPNTAKLIGAEVEGGMHLVFVLSPHGSLESFLHESEERLDWEKRYRIAVGTAKGLEYLHQRCRRRIIHRDIKAANILLTEDFEPQICDFGLAKWLPDQVTHQTSSNFEGTFGYLAPEYCTDGVVDEKTDVFAFGILLLELITGRRAITSEQESLSMWAKPLLEQDKIKELVDPSLGDSYDEMQLIRAANTARSCIQHSPVMRPCMSKVISALTGEEDEGDSRITTHQKETGRRTNSEGTDDDDEDEYNETKNLNDLDRHKQIAFDFQNQ
ncbi:receptor-like cytosolic serine/threonine-protein kinase RBK2 [Zingiber officinale]|uniref:receptor-like cytosolic serine/threonine-protein kinase RBK2 n=1 Tax=Zingiber officinale TaxID=94328 RepID=UPI001C4A7AA7|nr:receptor-like cytosolic serine/threonine-protein kinase RBK2 [Zingiber officinale]